MRSGFFQSAELSARKIFDPRTKLLMVITIGTVIMADTGVGWMSVLIWILTFVPLALFLIERKWKAALIYFCVYWGATAMQTYLLPLTTGVVNFLLVAMSFFSVRFMPGIAMASYMVNTTTVSEFMGAMERMRVPQGLSIPLSVVFRFFPTVAEEYAAISDAMRMRGIRFGGKKPGKIIEYRLVPLLVCCVKIGDELSAAALTRGLGAPIRRTNVCRIGLRAQDIFAMAVCFAMILLFLFERLGGAGAVVI